MSSGRTISSVTYEGNVRDDVHHTTGVPNWMAKMGVAYHNECTGWTIGFFDSFFGDPTVAATAAPLNPDPQAYHLASLNMTLDPDHRLRHCHRCTRTGR